MRKRRGPILVLGTAAAGLVLLFAAQEGPGFRSIQTTGTREIALEVTGGSGGATRIETSTNLRDWEGFRTLPGAALSVQTDSAAPFHVTRFYRARELSGTNWLTGDHLPTDQGDVVIRPINHATFVLQWEGKTIYNDPVGASSVFQGVPRADLVLVSHSHGDHFNSSTIEAIRKTNAMIVVPQAVYNSLSAAGKSVAMVLTNGARAQVLGLTIEAVPAYNANHSKGTGNGYVLTIGGRRIYASGDTEDVPEMRRLESIDVAFLCMNVPFTMSVERAASAVREFRPKVVYPYHYRNQDSTFANLKLFQSQVGSETEVRLRKWY